MRRTDREVTDPAEITEMMTRCEVLHLALNTDTVPYILPVNFGMEPDGMTLYIHGAWEGTKYTLIEKDNRAGFELDCTHSLVLENGACSINYESVIGWGYLEDRGRAGGKAQGTGFDHEAVPGRGFPIQHCRDTQNPCTSSAGAGANGETETHWVICTGANCPGVLSDTSCTLTGGGVFRDVVHPVQRAVAVVDGGVGRRLNAGHRGGRGGSPGRLSGRGGRRRGGNGSVSAGVLVGAAAAGKQRRGKDENQYENGIFFHVFTSK